MKRSMKVVLPVLLLVPMLAGCASVQMWKDILEGKGLPKKPDSSPSSSPVQVSPAPSASGSAAPSSAGGGGDASFPEVPEYPEYPRDPEPSAPPMPALDPELEQLQEEISRSGSMAGLAFVGYVGGIDAEEDLRSYLLDSDIGIENPFLPEAALVMAGGDELYAVVPPNESGTVTVYASGITERGDHLEYLEDKSTPLYEGTPGEAVLVRCNVSEIYSNVLITVTDGGGAMDFRPCLSMENGHIAETPGVYDFSIYLDEPDGMEVQLAMERLMQVPEVRTLMQQGMQLMYGDQTERVEGQNCLLFVLGTDHEDHFVQEFFYGVSEDSIFLYDVLNDVWIYLAP